MVPGAGRRYARPDRDAAGPPGRAHEVGAITAELDVGQSTVSEHLKILAGVRFVLADKHGTATYYRSQRGVRVVLPVRR